MRPITAAGAVVVRLDKGKSPKVLLVHRPRYDDWSLPKGKLDSGEYIAGCAVREVFEESGVNARLGVPMDIITYDTPKGPKAVYFWRASVLREQRFKPNGETDKLAWLTPSAALKRMTYADELAVLEQAVSMPETTPLLIVRHAKAMLRKNWSGRDAARPLDGRGRRQSIDLIKLLHAYGVSRLASSTSNRCMATLKPFGKEEKLDITGWATLSEEQGVDNPKSVDRLMKRLVTETVSSGKGAAVCGHRPVLPTMLAAVGVPIRAMTPATAAVLHLESSGRVHSVEWVRPLR